MNAKDEDGNTALHIAAEVECHPIASLLLKHGANFVIRNGPFIVMIAL
jgi:ankyrin repeat protein